MRASELVSIVSLPREEIQFADKITVGEFIELFRKQNPVFSMAYMDCTIDTGEIMPMAFSSLSSRYVTNLVIESPREDVKNVTSLENPTSQARVIREYKSEIGQYHERKSLNDVYYSDNYYVIDGKTKVDHPIMNMNISSDNIRTLGKETIYYFIDIELS